METEADGAISDKPNPRVGPYEIIRAAEAKAGSQGRVFRARCVEQADGLSVGTEVALKEMLLPFEEDKHLNRAKRTIETLKANPHQGIVGYHSFFIFDPGTFSERQCVVMDYLNGKTLSEKIERHRYGMEWDEVRRIFLLAISALRHAKDLGIIHRDIKPSNIFLADPDETPKIIDFEIARHETETQSTHSGLHGSFDYMAPEFHPRHLPYDRFSGDEKSDIYSLAACMYEAFTGSLPFGAKKGAGHQGFFERAENPPSDNLVFSRRRARPLIGLKRFFEKGLAFKREERFQTFAEMEAAFLEVRRETVFDPDGLETYEMMAWVGRGGFAEVFRARRLSDNSVVALKCLRRDRYADLFLKEARLLQSVRHPNVVEAFGLFRLADVERYFLVLEYLPDMPGASLQERLRRNKSGLAVEETVELFLGYAAGLSAMHEEYNIIHRDIKPGNLYSPEGRPHKGKLLDLGIARDMRGTVSVGPVPGTFEYMAPEFGIDKNTRGTFQTDLYSLGLCLYRTLTGKAAFPPLPREPVAATISEYIKRCRNPPSIDFNHPVFDRWPALKVLLTHTLAHDPKRRFRSASEFASELKNVFRAPHDEEATRFTNEFGMMTGFAGGEGTLATEAVSSAVSQPNVQIKSPGTTVTKTRAVLGEARVAVQRKRRRRLAQLGLTLGLAWSLLATAYGGMWWWTQQQIEKVRSLSESSQSLRERFTRLREVSSWYGQMSWLGNLAVNVDDVRREAREAANALGEQIIESLRPEPLGDWRQRLVEANEILGMDGAGVVFGGDGWGHLRGLREAKWRDYQALSVPLSVKNPFQIENLAVSIRKSEDGGEGSRLIESENAWSTRLPEGDWVLGVVREGFERRTISQKILFSDGMDERTVLLPQEGWKKTEWLSELESLEKEIARTSIDGVELDKIRVRMDQIQTQVATTGFSPRWDAVKSAWNLLDVERKKRAQEKAEEERLAKIKEEERRKMIARRDEIRSLVNPLSEPSGREFKEMVNDLLEAAAQLEREPETIAGVEILNQELEVARQNLFLYLKNVIVVTADQPELQTLADHIQFNGKVAFGENKSSELLQRIVARQGEFEIEAAEAKLNQDLRRLWQSTSGIRERLADLDRLEQFVEEKISDADRKKKGLARVRSHREEFRREESNRLLTQLKDILVEGSNFAASRDRWETALIFQTEYSEFLDQGLAGAEIATFRRNVLIREIGRLIGEARGTVTAAYTEKAVDQATKTFENVTHFIETEWVGVDFGAHGYDEELEGLQEVLNSRLEEIQTQKIEEAIKDYEDLPPSARLVDRLAVLQRISAFPGGERRDEVVRFREELVQELLDDISNRDSNRSDTLKRLQTVLDTSEAESALGSEGYSKVGSAIKKEFGVFVWEFSNKTDQNLDLSFGRQTKEVKAGVVIRFALEANRDGLEAVVKNALGNGYETRRLGLPGNGGGFSRFEFNKPLEILPISIRVRRPDLGEARIQTSKGPGVPFTPSPIAVGEAFSVVPGERIEVTWRRADFFPIEKTFETQIGQDLIIEAPASQEWIPSPALEALWAAEDAILDGKTIELGSIDKPLLDVNHEKRRKIALELANAATNLVEANFGGAIDALDRIDAQNALNDSPLRARYQEIKQALNRYRASVVDPTARNLTLAGGRNLSESDWNQIVAENPIKNGHKIFSSPRLFDRKTARGSSLVYDQFFEARTLPVSLDAYDLALVFYLEALMRGRIYADFTRKGSNDSNTGMADSHSRDYSIPLLEYWSKADAEQREMTKRLVQNWSDPELREAVLPVPGLSENPTKDKSLLFFTEVAGADRSQRNLQELKRLLSSL